VIYTFRYRNFLAIGFEHNNNNNDSNKSFLWQRISIRIRRFNAILIADRSPVTSVIVIIIWF